MPHTSSNVGAGTIGGLTFTPGTYFWSSTVNAASNITLSGNSNSQFIFQIAQTFNLGTNANVILVGGVQPCNIFWAIAGATTLGVNSNF